MLNATRAGLVDHPKTGNSVDARAAAVDLRDATLMLPTP